MPKEIPPIFKTPAEDGQSPLRRFTGHDGDTTLILGLRRVPAVASPNQNSNTAIAICTSVGFSQYTVQEYITATQILKPDIVVGPGDVAFVPAKPSQKRVEKATDRTAYWMKELLLRTQQDAVSMWPGYQIFAPVLPVPWEQQRWYTELLLEDEMRPFIAGLAVYDADDFHEPPDTLSCLPRLALTLPSSPAHILRQVWLGMDLFVLPFIGAATDAGIALDFSFPAPSAINGTYPSPVGVDCWDPNYATDLSPLHDGCQCYTCQRHHRAYLQHLLHAKEMLGWVLLQVHNHHVMDEFFACIRSSIEKGTFERDMEAFNRYYERELPEKTGQGPRYVYLASFGRQALMIEAFEATNESPKAVVNQRRIQRHLPSLMMPLKLLLRRIHQVRVLMLVTWKSMDLER